MMLILCVVFLLLQPTAGAGEGSLSALKFGNDIGSYIVFKPEMSPFRNAFSVCAWVRKLRTSGGPVWFSYNVRGSDNEIFASDNGDHNLIFDKNLGLRSKFTVSPGTWYHYCGTWAAATQTYTVYLNGLLVGSMGTPSGRTLGVDGYLMLGNEQDSYGGGAESSQIFGGELYQMNMYSKELPASQVYDMAAGGLCSGMEEEYDEIRHLKWETILQQERNGDVKNIDSGCGPAKSDVLQTRLDDMENELNRTKVELVETREELKETKDRLNKTEHLLDVATRQQDNTTRQLNNTQTDLQKTTSDLQESAQRLNQTTLQLKEATRLLENTTECTTHWYVLYSEPFLNSVFTRDLFLQLRSSWDVLEDFVGSGVRLTEDVIDHFKSYQALRLAVREGCDTEDGM